jgi:hypothetical protein
MLTPWHLLAKWCPDKHELLHFIAPFLHRDLSTKQSRLSSNDLLPNDKLSSEWHLLGRWQLWENIFTEVTHLYILNLWLHCQSNYIYTQAGVTCRCWALANYSWLAIVSPIHASRKYIDHLGYRPSFSKLRRSALTNVIYTKTRSYSQSDLLSGSRALLCKLSTNKACIKPVLALVSRSDIVIHPMIMVEQRICIPFDMELGKLF